MQSVDAGSVVRLALKNGETFTGRAVEISEAGVTVSFVRHKVSQQRFVQRREIERLWVGKFSPGETIGLGALVVGTFFVLIYISMSNADFQTT